jgi:predicted  nucleic acid-binding Zn-ribbon protein
MVGMRAKCPKCGLKVTVPAESEYVSNRSNGAELDAESDAEGDAEMDASVSVAAQTDTFSADHLEPETAANPFEDARANWYVRPADGNRYGPAKADMMQAWVAEGRVTPDSLVWRDGWPTWRPAKEVFGAMVETTSNGNPSIDASPIVNVDTAGIPDFTAGILDGMAMLNREQVNRVRIKRKQEHQFWLVFSGILLLLILILVVVLLFAMRNN